MNDIMTIIWLYLPMAIANMGPVIANNIPLLKKYDQPLDFHKTFRGKRIFGDHKSIRGILAGTVVGLLVAIAQYIIIRETSWFDRFTLEVDYTSSIVWLMGACLGFGALAGDAVKSFFKRQIGIEPGNSWAPFDQLDFAVGGLLASLPFFIMPLRLYIIGVVLALVLHPIINILGWLLRLQEKPL